MKISGFTIIKNAVINDYPIVEAILSILPVVDEMVVLIGDSADETKQLIQHINHPKIKIFDSVWDSSLRSGGSVLAVETNKALQLIDKNSTWAFYIQADEVVHEQYLPAIRNACERYASDKNVEGLLFNYLHFYGTYDYVGDSRKWYNKEVRIIRNDLSISSYKDAQGFRKQNNKLHVKLIDAFIFHYGWVKSPEQMMKKRKEVGRFWVDDEGVKNFDQLPDEFNFEEYDSIAAFTGTHPQVMLERIKKKNWHINLDLNEKKFHIKDYLLYQFEKLTGIRMFDFKNYKLLK
jgi:hypothetical protein